MCAGAKAAELRWSRGCWMESPGLRRPRPLVRASARRHFFDLFPPSLSSPSHFPPELLLPTRAAALVTHDFLMSVTLCLLLAGASYKLTTRLQRSSRLLYALFSHLVSERGSFWFILESSQCPDLVVCRTLESYVVPARAGFPLYLPSIYEKTNKNNDNDNT